MNRMTTDEVKELVDSNKEVQIIDVRETEEVRSGMIPGALHIPLGLLEFRLQDIDKSKEHIMVCRSGGRSGMASELLESRGYKVVNMEGGMLDWDGPTE